MSIEQNRDFSAEIERLKKVVKKVPLDRRAIAENMLVEIQFMGETLEKLRQHVEQHGVIDLFRQGKQKFYRESPALKAYNTTLQRYTLLNRQIVDMLPKPDKKKKAHKDALMAFIKNG